MVCLLRKIPVDVLARRVAKLRVFRSARELLYSTISIFILLDCRISFAGSG